MNDNVVDRKMHKLYLKFSNSKTESKDNSVCCHPNYQ